MIRARLLLGAITTVAFLVIVWLAFVPREANDLSSAASAFMQFALVSGLLVLMFGRRRWWVALGFAVLGASWIEAAQSVWMPPGYALITDTLAGTAGAATGALLTLGALALARRTNAPSAVVEGVHSNQQG
jgi:hypothetical protein